MNKFFGMLPVAIACFCTATVLAQAAGLGVLWSKGWLTRAKSTQVLAALYGMEEELTAAGETDGASDREQPGYEDVVRARIESELDHALRKGVLDKGVDDLRRLDVSLKADLTRFRMLKESFDNHLADLEGEALDTSIQDVQRTLEALMPKQAKDQLMKMIDDGDMEDVVTIVRAMAIDKRRKILGEFKAGDEAEKLHDILLAIREETPIKNLVLDTRKEVRK